MFRKLGLLVIAFAFIQVTSQAQSPSKAPDAATLNLSLKTMGKALAGCKESYLYVQNGTSVPLIKAILGEADYEKDMTSLRHAETFVNTMAAHPERVTGKSLVATLSSTDDFSVGVGSTRLAILSNLISVNRKANAPSPDELLVASQSLADCQKALFNAGDDFVDIVMNYVGAEDDVMASTKGKR
jgi:hypothetical protein